jgi:uncharacterized lipoprotein YehR (DUF1307 family)
MKKCIQVTTLVIGILMITSLQGTAQSSDAIIGKWYSGELEKSTIEISKGDKGNYIAKFIASGKPDYVNKFLFSDCTYDSKENHYKTTLTPTSGFGNVNATITISGSNMKIVGKKLVMTKTFNFVRKTESK